MKPTYLLISLILLLAITGCTSETPASEPPTTEPPTPELTDLQENICTQNSDCWSTNGGCFTREWFAIEDAKAREQGREDQRPIATPDIPCTCEQNKCIQHVE